LDVFTELTTCGSDAVGDQVVLFLLFKRYEIVRASDAPDLMLILPEGSWQSLPFEIRLLYPWHESECSDGGWLTSMQRSEIAAQGYRILSAANAVCSRPG
jgi:hypothetical protein